MNRAMEKTGRKKYLMSFSSSMSNLIGMGKEPVEFYVTFKNMRMPNGMQVVNVYLWDKFSDKLLFDGSFVPRPKHVRPFKEQLEHFVTMLCIERTSHENLTTAYSYANLLRKENTDA